jgi:hypothetical protein
MTIFKTLSPNALLPQFHLVVSFHRIFYTHTHSMLSSPRTLLTSILFTTCLSASKLPQPTLHPRQDEAETRTVDPLTSSMELQGGVTTVEPSPTTTYRLETATAPIHLADTIGLIMPNPWSKVYVGEFGPRAADQADIRS